MADYTAQFERIRQNLLNRIEEVTERPKPNYSIDGQQVSWADYLKQLQEALNKLNETEAATSEDGGLFEFETILFPQ